MKNILILTDFSKNAWNALQYSQQLFKPIQCNFYLLHVSDFISSPVSPVSFEGDEDLSAKVLTVPSKKQLNELLKKIEKKFSNQNHNYFGVHEHGFFLEIIRKNITEKNIDLIVMGTKGVTGLREHIIGSNAGDVITKVKCNTLVIPNEVAFSIPQEVAFPTDYNIFYSHRILEAITEMLKLCQGNIYVMNVSRSNKQLTKSQEKNQEYLLDYLNETFQNKNSFHSINNKSVNAAIQSFVEGRNIDMIVMVAKNLNFIQQILFDSVVEKISFHTTVSIYVIHE